MGHLDIPIVQALNENARKSLRELSRDFNVSISTISNRVKKLEKQCIILEYILLINKEKLGYDLIVVINIKIAHGKLIDVQ